MRRYYPLVKDPSPTDSTTDGRYRTRFATFAALGLVLAVLSKMYAGPGEKVIRGNLDDVFIVHAVYFTLRAFIPRLGNIRTALAVCLLAVSVELLQGAGVFSPKLSGAAGYWLGQYFDVLDIAAYVVGATTSLLIERGMRLLE
ncbi:MAG: DUF2809 domain-containing protein [Bdellovibrionota bacterium]